MIKIYHNPRCKKSRAGLTRLKLLTDDFEIVEYLKTPLTRETLENLFAKIDLPAEDLIRKQEQVYKEKYKGKKLSESEWIEAIIEHPKLLQRPIVEKDGKAVLADPPDNLDILFK